MGRRQTKESQVNFDDVRTFARAVNINGKAVCGVRDGEVVRVSDIEHCFGVFLNAIDKDIIEREKEFSKLKKKTDDEIEVYLNGLVKGITQKYQEMYGIDVDNVIGKKEITIDKDNNFEARTIFIIQHLLRLNGYEIDTSDYRGETKAVCEEIFKTSSHKVTLPLKFIGKGLIESNIISRFKAAQYKQGQSYVNLGLESIKNTKKR